MYLHANAKLGLAGRFALVGAVEEGLSLRAAAAVFKDTGLRNLPFADFQMNTAWLELVLIAQDLLAWTQALLVDGELARCEPKRLRYRLLHVAARVTHTGRRTILHLPRSWPWRDALTFAFLRLRSLPAP